MDFSIVGSAIGETLQFDALFGIAGGVFLGYIIGVIPGLSRSVAIAIAIPMTFYMSPLIAISFLIGLSKGTAAGSAVSAILLNAPGEASSAATSLDGYPMAKSGKPRTALQVGLLASVIGDILATTILIFVAIPFARVALLFGPYEMAAILAFALVFIAGLSGGDIFKGLAAGALGVLLGTIGLDSQTGLPRLTFGYTQLMDGMPLIAVAIGTLALSEMFVQSEKLRYERETMAVKLENHKGDRITFPILRKIFPTILRGTGVGTFVGALPGLGPSVGSWMSYGMAKRASRTPEQFGKGAPEGVAASESADNAVIPAALIPLFGLGIPGNVSAALLIGAFAIHGITVGPLLLRDEPELLYSIFAGMIVASIFMLILGWFGLMVFAQITRVPPHVVIPIVIFFCLAGMLLQGYGAFGLIILIAFAALGYLMKKYDYSFVTFLVAFIITPMLELNLRQSIILSRGNWEVLLGRPIALFFIACTLLAFIILAKRTIERKKPIAEIGD
ncbi:MAG: tripartite tricarboxylate transporter permease [Rhodobacteraceae bacterium]|nr:tripartite tricarboxylate transporter permease [Paracoccaceae bacterium]